MDFFRAVFLCIDRCMWTRKPLTVAGSIQNRTWGLPPDLTIRLLLTAAHPKCLTSPVPCVRSTVTYRLEIVQIPVETKTRWVNEWISARIGGFGILPENWGVGEVGWQRWIFLLEEFSCWKESAVFLRTEGVGAASEVQLWGGNILWNTYIKISHANDTYGSSVRVTVDLIMWNIHVNLLLTE